MTSNLIPSSIPTNSLAHTMQSHSLHTPICKRGGSDPIQLIFTRPGVSLRTTGTPDSPSTLTPGFLSLISLDDGFALNWTSQSEMTQTQLQIFQYVESQTATFDFTTEPELCTLVDINGLHSLTAPFSDVSSIRLASAGITVDGSETNIPFFMLEANASFSDEDVDKCDNEWPRMWIQEGKLPHQMSSAGSAGFEYVPLPNTGTTTMAAKR
jgi:hypothetical protein